MIKWDRRVLNSQSEMWVFVNSRWYRAISCALQCWFYVCLTWFTYAYTQTHLYTRRHTKFLYMLFVSHLSSVFGAYVVCLLYLFSYLQILRFLYILVADLFSFSNKNRPKQSVESFKSKQFQILILVHHFFRYWYTTTGRNCWK